MTHQQHHHGEGTCGCGCTHDHSELQAQPQSQSEQHAQHNASEAESTEDGAESDSAPSHSHQETATASCGCGHDHYTPEQKSKQATTAENHPTSDGCSCGCELAAQNPHAHTAHDDDHGHDHGQKESPKERIALISAIALFVLGIFLEDWAWIPFLGAYLLAGVPVLLQMLRNFRQGRIFDENTLMSIASLGAWVIGAQLEAAAVMLLYRIGEAIQARAVLKSRESIAALTDIRPEKARLLAADGSFTEVKPENVQPGQLLQVRPGERIPVDGIVESGNAHLDLSALTGESLPVPVSAGAEIKAGAINQDGLLVIKSLRSYQDSAVAQILRLLEESGAHKAPIESMIGAFARRYTPLVTLAALLLFAIPTLTGGAWQVWLYRALVFLAASCPCALIISVPLTYYAGLGAAAKVGALIKGGNYLAALPQVNTVVFDKTGTLTEGRFQVSGITTANGISEQDLLYYAAQAESTSNHPLAQAICNAYREASKQEPVSAESLQEEAGLGIVAQVDGHPVLVGNARLLQKYGITGAPESSGTALHVAVGGSYAGSITVQDRIKPHAKQAITELHQLGVKKTVLLSGDTPKIAENIARELGIDEAHGGLLPEDKVTRLQELLAAQGAKEKLLFMGDGINDAPSLALADIGVAMGGLGAEAATAAADLVLLQDDPQQLVQATRIARRTNRIAKQNIIFSLGIKLIVLALSAFGITGMALAVFADVGVALIAVANGMRAMRQPQGNTPTTLTPPVSPQQQAA